jgi:hypothetical protein
VKVAPRPRWGELTFTHQAITLPRTVPVLLLGEAEGDPRPDVHPRPPKAVDAARLLAAGGWVSER